ncbi:YwiC-like family protein [Paenibacillus sp. GCM10027629]|uniref:YwiC-like family protein n=1 Tax=Paenibacillus sp. GCM10027629 TaxID=3273414 RepID=UPI0036440949
MKIKNIVIPHEHGGWAMVSVPFLFGMIAGTPQWSHILLFIAWLFLYLASYPFLQAIKRSKQRDHLLKWSAIYGVIAMASLVYPLIAKPQLLFFGIPFVVLLTVNIWHVKQKSERAIVNDLCAILLFSLGGAAAYLFGGGGWDSTMLAVVGFNFLYFMGTAFFVKTIFRERGNMKWEAAARIYHVLMLFVPWVCGYPWMTLPFVFPLIRTLLFAGKQVRPMKAGILEIIGAVQFIVISWIVF